MTESITRSEAFIPTYGPTSGRDAIVAGVGPQTVTAPEGAIEFDTLGALQTAIDANSADSDFVATATSYTVTSSPGLTWTAGKRPRIYFPGAPGTCTITSSGDYIGISPPTPSTSESEGYFEVYGGTWVGFGSSGSAFSRAAFVRRGSCTISDVECHTSQKMLGSGGRIDLDYLGHGLSGVEVIVRRCHIHDCWQSGINDGGYGAPAATAHQQNYLLEYNEVNDNNQDLLSPGGDVAGAKMLFQVGEYHSNYFHDNNSWGLWFDTANKFTSDYQVTTAGAVHVHDNVFENNARPGLFFERSGYGYIHNNWFDGNGNGGTIGGQTQTSLNAWQFLVRNSRNCQVSYNDVDTALGIERSLGLAQQSDETALDNEIHHNRVWLRTASARFGGYDDNTPETLFTESSNTWHDNLSMVASLGTSYWQWAANEAAISWASWQAFDINGLRQVI